MMACLRAWTLPASNLRMTRLACNSASGRDRIDILGDWCELLRRSNPKQAKAFTRLWKLEAIAAGGGRLTIVNQAAM